MNQDDDPLLIAQIESAADAAKARGTNDADVEAMAAALHDHFPHREEADILRLMKEVWRRRGIFWRD